MSHLDEGTLHALLDGELETTEVAEIQAHLGSCSACGLRLREVKEFLADADRLIASVELGAQSVGAAPPAAQREAASRADPVARPEAPVSREPSVRPRPSAEVRPREPWNEPPPVLLIPDNESAADRRMRRLRRFGWAALIVGVAGAGFLGISMRPNHAGVLPIASRSTVADSGAVVSQEEAAPRADEATTPPESSALALRAQSLAKPKAATPASGAPSAPRRNAERELAVASPKPAPPPPAVQPRVEQANAASEDKADVQTIDSLAETAADSGEADSAAAGDIATVKIRAAEALADLDRERRRSQAAAATAALDAERRRRAATGRTTPAPTGAVTAGAAPAPTPPAPPTIEQRAQVYLRIGLDEASRQLGGPAHVIEGLSPMFMGLARGASVLGADATRPVVRVVYQDSQGRLILLDQQRLRTGHTPPAPGPLSWLIGDTVMWLNGEASGEILRTYRPRVR